MSEIKLIVPILSLIVSIIFMVHNMQMLCYHINYYNPSLLFTMIMLVGLILVVFCVKKNTKNNDNSSGKWDLALFLDCGLLVLISSILCYKLFVFLPQHHNISILLKTITLATYALFFLGLRLSAGYLLAINISVWYYMSLNPAYFIKYIKINPMLPYFLEVILLSHIVFILAYRIIRFILAM